MTPGSLPFARDDEKGSIASDARAKSPRFTLSPMNRRRLENFRRNRRGYWSFWIFLVLFVASMGSEFLANDRPLIASYKGEISVSRLRRLP